MKKGTKNVLRVLISIVYIVWGIWSPISALKAVLALDMGVIFPTLKKLYQKLFHEYNMC